METAVYLASLAAVLWTASSVSRIASSNVNKTDNHSADRGLPFMLVPLGLVGLVILLEHARLYGPSMDTLGMRLAVGFTRRCMGGAWLFFCTAHYRLYSLVEPRHRLTPWLLWLSLAANLAYVALNLVMGPGAWDTASMGLMVAVAFYAGADAMFLAIRHDAFLASSKAGIRIAMMTMVVYPVVVISDLAGVRFPGLSHGRPMWSQTNPLYLLVLLAMLEPALPKTSRTDIQASDNSPTESANGLPKLSQREHQVLRLIMEGKRYKEIAAALDITMPTVKSHVSSAYRKLGVKGRADLHRRSLLQWRP